MTPIMLDLPVCAAKIGMAVDTLRSWRHRAKSGLPLDASALAFAGLIRKHGTRLRVDEANLQAWMRDRRGGAHGDKSENQIAETARELAAIARACGLDCCADALHLAERLAEEARQLAACDG